MQPFASTSGVAVPFPMDDVNTDQIAPALRGLGMKPDYAKLLFARWRWHQDGTEDPSFVLNKPQFQNPAILVTGRNFGAGSSRESAIWSMLAVGIHCIIARSFADIYRENCLQNGLLPVTLPEADFNRLEASVNDSNGKNPFTVDLTTQTIAGPDNLTITFDITPAERTRLLEGLDDIGLTLKHLDAISEWEQKTKQQTPWLQEAKDRRQALLF